MDHSSRPKQVLMFYQPRSACRVLTRILFEKQNDVQCLEHLFGDSRGYQVEWLRKEDYHTGMDKSKQEAFTEATARAIEQWRDALRIAHQEERLLAVQTYPFAPVDPDKVLEISRLVSNQELCPPASNFTMIPDELLLAEGTLPVIVIRDPRLVVTSAYRVLKAMGESSGGGRPMFLVTTSTIWSRMLYNFYDSQGMKPIVVDSDEFLTSEAFSRHLATRVGVDASQVCFSWPPLWEDEKGKMHPLDYLSSKGLFESSGVNPNRAARNIDFEQEERAWETEFGDDVDLVKEMIERAMPHYRYLQQRTLRQ